MEYLIKVSAVTFLFYACYKLFLQRDTFFETNRWFLLVGIVISFIVPLIVIPVYFEQVPIPLPNFGVSNNEAITTTSTSFNVLEYLSFIYITGVLLLSVRFIIQLTSLFRIISINKIKRKDGFKLIETSTNDLPFSFFNWVVYNPAQFKTNELEQIITHEKVHVKQYHSIDSLLIQISSIVLWFNPFIWLYNKDLKQNLEFIADKHTQQQSDCKKSYQYTLLKTSLASHQLAITNNFYNSLIKKRITMLQKSESKKINLFKYTLIIPILAVFIFNFNTKVIAQNKDDNQVVKFVKKSDSTTTFKLKSDNAKHPLLIVDGKEFPHEKLESINPDHIEAINVLKDENVTKKYGDKGKNGVIIIKTKDIDLNKSTLKLESIALYIIDGKESSDKDFKSINHDHIESINVLKGEAATTKYGDKGKNGVVVIATKNDKEDIKFTRFRKVSNSNENIKNGNKIEINNDQHPLVILDGKEFPHEKIESINPDNIEAINVLKDESATKKYGDKGKNGVIEITSKKK